MYYSLYRTVKCLVFNIMRLGNWSMAKPDVFRKKERKKVVFDWIFHLLSRYWTASCADDTTLLLSFPRGGVIVKVSDRFFIMFLFLFRSWWWTLIFSRIPYREVCIHESIWRGRWRIRFVVLLEKVFPSTFCVGGKILWSWASCVHAASCIVHRGRMNLGRGEKSYQNSPTSRACAVSVCTSRRGI